MKVMEVINVMAVIRAGWRGFSQVSGPELTIACAHEYCPFVTPVTPVTLVTFVTSITFITSVTPLSP